MGRVLLVDDDKSVLFTLNEVMLDRGHEPITAASAEEGLSKLDAVDVAIIDLAMPGMDGLALLRAMRARDESLPVIMLTAHGSERVAVEATKAGAYDYMKKPFDIDDVVIVVERALEARRLRVTNLRLEAEQAIGQRIVGDSAAMRKLLDGIGRVAGKDVTVLLTGETGSGKELAASLLHAQSKRAKGPLVRFNCAAIPGELAEAELFGHTKGAFTGAQTARRGFFAQADGGTLVLDEIGELPLAIQAKLLRALQDGEIQPVGSGRVEKVDVRIVASTHRDLAAEARAGRFREDLYYRLAVVELRVPALRERRDDVAPLAREFARRYAAKFGLDDVALSPALLAALARSDWPGNVRQLENTIARLVALSPGGEIDVAALGEPAGAEREGEPAAEGVDDATADDALPLASLAALTLRQQVEAFERGIIARTLAACGRNQSEAARRLGVSRVTLIDKMKKYALHEA
jgi:DNA-binding NtrC family response regulator